MARKRTAHRKKGEGTYWFDKKNQRHIWTLEYGGRRYTATDRDSQRAEAKFEALRRQVLGGIDMEGGRQLLSDWFQHYLTTEVAHQNKQSTTHDYAKRADYYILPTLGEYRLCDLRRHIIIAWVNAMLETTTSSGRPWSLISIRQVLRLLQRALQSAVDEGYLEDNPAASVKVPRRRKGDELQIDRNDDERARALTPAQTQRFLDEVRRTERQHGVTLLYELTLTFGLRRGEVLGLRWRDIDMEQRIMSVRQQVIRLDTSKLVTTPKTELSRRDIPITDEMVARLCAHRDGQSEAQRAKGLIFPNSQGEERSPAGLTQHCSRVFQRIGLGGFSFHSLRKTAITDMRRHGADAETTAAIAGHGVHVMANIYSDAQMDRKREAVERRGKAG